MVELEPSLQVQNGSVIPQLAFGLYKVPGDEVGVKIILEAIKVGVTTLLWCRCRDLFRLNSFLSHYF